MSEPSKTHRERAALAADHVLALVEIREAAKGRVYASDLTPRIARDTFPTELVEAARALVPVEGQLIELTELPDLIEALRAALTAYEETP